MDRYRAPGAGLPCPVCNVELRPTDRNGIEIDFCPQCRGVWLDRGELDKIMERSATMYRTEYRPDRRPDYDDDDDDDRRYRQPYPQGHRKRGFLGEIFDFD
jgi:Zn-finger nucleic acid-binding protein